MLLDFVVRNSFLIACDCIHEARLRFLAAIEELTRAPAPELSLVRPPAAPIAESSSPTIANNFIIVLSTFSGWFRLGDFSAKVVGSKGGALSKRDFEGDSSHASLTSFVWSAGDTERSEGTIFGACGSEVSGSCGFQNLSSSAYRRSPPRCLA